jgi:hypothetical protein
MNFVSEEVVTEKTGVRVSEVVRVRVSEVVRVSSGDINEVLEKSVHGAVLIKNEINYKE